MLKSLKLQRQAALGGEQSSPCVAVARRGVSRRPRHHVGNHAPGNLPPQASHQQGQQQHVSTRDVSANSVASMPPSDFSNSSSGLLADEVRAMPENHVADTLWAYVMTHGYDPSICATICATACEDIGRFQPSSLVAMLSAFAHVGHEDRDFVVTACQSLAAPYQLAEVDTGTLAQAAWVIALLSSQGVVRFDHEEVVQDMMLAVLRMSQRKVADFAPDDLARLFAALGELQAPPPTALVEGTSARLLGTLIPLAQLETTGLAQMMWAYARLGLYDRAVFDAAQAELMRKCDELGWQGLAHTSWAYGQVRSLDRSHRSIYDVNLLATLAAQAVRQLQDACAADKAAENAATAATASTSNAVVTDGSDSPSSELAALTAQVAAKGNAAATAGGAGVGQGASGEGEGGGDTGSAVAAPPPARVSQSHLMTLLLSFANLSHHDGPLFTWAAKWLADRTDDSSAQDLVVMAYVYARVKHRAPELMLSLATAVPKVIEQFDGDDLVHLAALGPSTTLYSEGLMKAVLQRAITLSQTSSTALDPAILLDLARCTAAVAGSEPEYYEGVSTQLLKAVNRSHLATDLEEMSTHCGATNEQGLQK